ncbi:MAG: glycosyltransferase family 39 protein [Betaproteobacteria bacterium]
MRVALAVIALAWFAVLFTRPLYRADESRYAEISREMVASGDWITPRLNGFKYFEKPPLQYWTTAAFFKAFGEHDAAARLWNALCGFAAMLLALGAARRLYGRGAGLLAAAVLAASPLYVVLGQLNTLDMGFSLFLSAAIFAFALGHVLAFWAACALAVLSKGLAGIVLPLGAVALYILVKRDWRRLARMQWLKGSGLFLVITAPWFVAVSLANAEFAHFFFVREHLERFTTGVHRREQPPWYFLAVLAVGMAPALLAALAGWWRGLRAGLVESGTAFDTSLFLALWVSVVIGFFSLSSSKLPAYILPAFPALAVLAAAHLVSDSGRRLLVAQSLLLVAAGAALAAVSGRFAGFADWMIAAGASLAAGGAISAFFAWRPRVVPWLAIIMAGGFIATQLAIAGHAAGWADRLSVASTVRMLAEKPPREAQVFALDAYDHTMPWYLRRPVTMVAGKDELGIPIEWEPHKYLEDMAAFRRAWHAAPQAYAFVDAVRYDTLREAYGVPMQVLARGARYVIVKKP